MGTPSGSRLFLKGECHLIDRVTDQQATTSHTKHGRTRTLEPVEFLARLVQFVA
jgi:hypothetical protein